MNEIDNCCLKTGSESPSTWCASKCRLYKDARIKADKTYHSPYIGTGFGNLNGIPNLREIRIEAGKILASQENNPNVQEGQPDITATDPIRRLKEQGLKLGKIDRNKSKPEDRNII